ncbi:hypothetical protein PHMEG_00022251 [Phytophthora megakarya]|uniref:Uncharacterized protein n=1 Tax=Phytophthora megakarya TaxID=4795 RepID=A0A225VJN3_9STRA|nr:hypothetical protein PHMEG_00022251 [Phytophthora megakarya]
MLSWKTLSLIVAAAVAMNGVAAIEQGYGGGVKLPSSTTATPLDESPVQSTPTSVDASSALDITDASNSVPTSYPSKSDTALPSGSGSSGLTTGSAVEGSSAVDQGSNASTPGKTGITFSNTGSAVEGSNAVDQGSNSFPATTSTSASGSAPCDNSLSLAGSSATGSDVAGSSATTTSASGSEPCEGSLSLASSASQSTEGSPTQDQGSAATTPTSEAGSSATTPISETGSEADTPTSPAGSEATTPTSSTGSDSTIPTQTDASAATESSGSATFPGTGTSCKRRLRRH